MPIATFHLQGGRHSDEAVAALLNSASRLYAEVLDSPLDRVRAFAQLYQPQHIAVGALNGLQGAPPAPFFEFIILTGRPRQQRIELLIGFTDLVVQHLVVGRELVRGRAIEVSPENWAIGGEPASRCRQMEIAVRAQEFR